MQNVISANNLIFNGFTCIIVKKWLHPISIDLRFENGFPLNFCNRCGSSHSYMFILTEQVSLVFFPKLNRNWSYSMRSLHHLMIFISLLFLNNNTRHIFSWTEMYCITQLNITNLHIKIVFNLMNSVDNFMNYYC